MSPELEHLIELQRLDTTIADARARIASHPQRLADADARLADSQHALDAAKELLKSNHDHRRALEKDAAVYQGRLTKFKDQLAGVKTNREYQAMQVEIETAQRELSIAEEKVLERMVADDTLGAGVKKAEAELAARTKEISAEKREMTTELTAIEAALTSAVAARAKLVATLDARVVAMFEQVSRQRKGVAICTATRDGLCSVCHVRLRPPVFQQVRQNAGVVQCESCQRILYWVPPPPPVEPPVVHPS
jgi:predicted  nucleic acid-binding Zn-ribbon protein